MPDLLDLLDLSGEGPYVAAYLPNDAAWGIRQLCFCFPDDGG